MDTSSSRGVASQERTGSRSNASGRSLLARFMSTLIRLGIWYTIFTILVRCPASTNGLTDSSAQVCGPYLKLKAQIGPYTEPYYDTYAAPYVEKARPYVETIDKNVYRPVAAYAISQYDKYGAARLEQAHVLVQREWSRTLRPRLLTVRETFVAAYAHYLASPVDQVYTLIRPKVDNAKAAGVKQYETVVLPTYEKTQPYVQRLYHNSHRFITETASPYVWWITDRALSLIQRRLWPPIRILYGENILPQLLKIKERLASYRDGKHLQDVVHAKGGLGRTPSASRPSTVQSKSRSTALPSAATKVSSSVGQHPTTFHGSASSSTATREARQVSEDLVIWQTKFAKATQQGAARLSERITSITEDQISRQVQGTGEELLRSLDETAKDTIEPLKPRIRAIIRNLPGDVDTIDDAQQHRVQEEIESTIRDAGKQVRDAAQRVRAWRQDYDATTESLVVSALDSVLEVVDNIRDLGLQEIGMRWASMDDGVSYKDWSEYHLMRKSFAEWRGTVQSVVSNHVGLQKSKKAAEDTEARGMAVAEDAARELARLKQVARWKLEARDDTDDFSTRYTPSSVAHAAQRAKNAQTAISDAIWNINEDAEDSMVSEVLSAKDTQTEAISQALDSAGSGSSSIAASASDLLVNTAADVAKSASASGSSIVSSSQSIPTIQAPQAIMTLGPDGQSDTRVSLHTKVAQAVSSSLGGKYESSSSSSSSRSDDTESIGADHLAQEL